MASTYSSALRLELMATGDQSGTWGDTTNTNLGTLLEQAITGVLSVAQGDVANLTLTTVNGGSDQARNAVVNVTGALTAARNVVVQTANKLYLIKNSTTGGFVLTAKTAAGTGVEIGSGTARLVYSDGTNVVDGQPGLWMGYTTTATAAGTTTLTVGSSYYQYFTGVTTQTITLPVASTLTLGQTFYFVNLSSGALTVNSSGANLVTTIAASSSAIVQCILTSGTTAASWNAVSVNLSNYLLLAGGTMTGTLINTGSTVGYTALQAISTEAAAAVGPIIELYRNSASPAVSDLLGQAIFYGQNSTPAKKEYASIQAVIVSPTAAAEASTLDTYVQVAGARTLGTSVGPALAVATNSSNVTTAPGISFIGDPNTGIGHSGADILDFVNNGVNTARIASTGARSTVIPSGSTLLPAFDCRAWVSFNGTGTIAITGSGNVSSITDGGVGKYAPNYTTSMPDANYAVVGLSTGQNGAVNYHIVAVVSQSVGSCSIETATLGSALEDPTIVNLAIFR